MGIKSLFVTVSFLLLSSLFDNAAARALAERDASGSNTVTASAAAATHLVGVSKSVLGASTNDPALRQADSWYWGPDSKGFCSYIRRE
jgi:hypothetical protein